MFNPKPLSDIFSRNLIKPYHGNIDKQTIHNTFYRDTLFTGKHSQVIIMSLKPHEAIGNEVHHVDQFFRLEQGRAKFILRNGKQTFILGPGGAATIPAGTWHNVVALDKPVKLYTVYSPANHPPHTREKVRPEND
jgi:mannose-6-phosphate isomerase-like protein (cupin superfamily)